MENTLEWWPASGRPEQLMILLHGVGAHAADLAPLAARLHAEFPQSVVLVPDGFEPFDADPEGVGRQWFSLEEIDHPGRRAERAAQVLPRLEAWVQAAQQASGLGPAATALVGFSQGSIVALELIKARDGLAGRVLSFSGRYGDLPDEAPRHTTLHFFHGSQDEVIPVTHARDAMQRLAELRGDATIDIAEGVGHEIPPVLLERALFRLRNHIPHRTWAAAMGAVPGLQERLGTGEDEE